jgi:hypothetical protein
MKFIGLMSGIALAIGLVGFSAELFAHETGPGDSSDGMIVTRHFTGLWEQNNQENHGLSLHVIDRPDASRQAVIFWYAFGEDRGSAWFIGQGDLVENRIEMILYEVTDIGFMQEAMPGNDSVEAIGSLVMIFDSCISGEVSYQTNHSVVGSGSFEIKRLAEVMNTHCSGGISDDMHADAMFGSQRFELMSARENINGSGHANYEDYSGHMEFNVDVDGLPDGDYHLYVGMQDCGDFIVQNGHGGMEFSSPGETGNMLMTFDPRGMLIEIHDGSGVVLSSFDNMFEEDDHGHHGDGDGHHGDDDHNYDCEFGSGHGMGHGMGGGMDECVDDGEFIELEVDLTNTGVLADAQGKAEWEMNSDRVEFSVEIEDVPVGSYPLKVGGNEVGIIEAFEMHDGDVYGHIKFRDPEAHDREHLDFEPRGQKIEVLQGDTSILEVEFPTE